MKAAEFEKLRRNPASRPIFVDPDNILYHRGALTQILGKSSPRNLKELRSQHRLSKMMEVKESDDIQVNGKEAYKNLRINVASTNNIMLTGDIAPKLVLTYIPDLTPISPHDQSALSSYL
jgi:hypothetical protein